MDMKHFRESAGRRRRPSLRHPRRGRRRDFAASDRLSPKMPHGRTLAIMHSSPRPTRPQPPTPARHRRS
jgi:hypothetical protein